MILLDTHVLIWLNEEDARLGPDARRLILDTVPSDLLVSAITIWEIALLVEKKRLVLDRDVELWLGDAMRFTAAGVAPITMQVAIESVKLPGILHADPADRFIVATARLGSCPLLTADQAILGYASHGHVQAIDASR